MGEAADKTWELHQRQVDEAVSISEDEDQLSSEPNFCCIHKLFENESSKCKSKTYMETHLQTFEGRLQLPMTTANTTQHHVGAFSVFVTAKETLYWPITTSDYCKIFFPL